MTLSNFAALLWILAWMAAIWRARQVDREVSWMLEQMRKTMEEVSGE